MLKLTDTQLVILTNATQRGDGAVLPLPKSLKANKGALAISLKSLLQRGLISERPPVPDEEVWRESECGDRYTLVVADAGLKSIGVDPACISRNNVVGKIAPGKIEAPTCVKRQEAPADPARPQSKQAILIDLLRRPDGASLNELTRALGWQAHSVRGAIAGAVKKKLGYTVLTEKHLERGRVYRIEATDIVVGR